MCHSRRCKPYARSSKPRHLWHPKSGATAGTSHSTMRYTRVCADLQNQIVLYRTNSYVRLEVCVICHVHVSVRPPKLQSKESTTKQSTGTHSNSCNASQTNNALLSHKASSHLISVLTGRSGKASFLVLHRLRRGQPRASFTLLFTAVQQNA